MGLAPMDRGPKAIRSYDPCSPSSTLSSCEGKIGGGRGGKQELQLAPPRVNTGPATGAGWQEGGKRSIISCPDTLEALSQPVATVDGPGYGPSPPPQTPPALEYFNARRSLAPLPLAHVFPPPLFLTAVLHSHKSKTQLHLLHPHHFVASATCPHPPTPPLPQPKGARSNPQSTEGVRINW